MFSQFSAIAKRTNVNPGIVERGVSNRRREEVVLLHALHIGSPVEICT